MYSGLREPPTFANSFQSNFRMMFREEWRQNVDFAQKRHIMMFPVMLALVTMIITVGLRFRFCFLILILFWFVFRFGFVLFVGLFLERERNFVNKNY